MVRKSGKQEKLIEKNMIRHPARSKNYTKKFLKAFFARKNITHTFKT